jgi:hypothetical protein
MCVMYSRTEFSISAQIPAAGASHYAAVRKPPASRVSIAEASALACAKEIVLSSENVASKYWTPNRALVLGAGLSQQPHRLALLAQHTDPPLCSCSIGQSWRASSDLY